MFGIRKYSDQRRPFTIADDNFILRAAMDGWGYQKIASHLKRSKKSIAGRHANLLEAQNRRRKRA